jgi:ABC-type nitrate/sulfonate/bicarbonate transport system substrate-binding protein
MPQLRNLSCIVVAAAAVLSPTPKATADDTLKVTVADKGSWETAAPHLGQQAGLFKKHGIVLDLSYAQSDQDIEQPVVSGSADVGVGVGLMEVLRAYADKDAPLRIIGATMTGSANYWYVAAGSPIQKAKDIGRGTIAYSKGGTAGQYDVFDFMDRNRLKARPVLTSGEVAAFDQVIAGKIDVGWATPPFGLEALEQDRIRVVAKANEIPKIRDRTGSVMIATADALQKRGDVLGRFLQAYRETIDWMYSDPAAPKAYAEFADLQEGLARRLRDEFFAKDMLAPDKIVGLSVIAKDATKSRYIRASMSRRELAELVQVPSSDRSRASAKSGGWFRLLAPRSP